jgi:hypothetical protein
VVDKTEWDAMRADVAEFRAVRADLAELKALVTQQYIRRGPQSESPVGQKIKETPEIELESKQSDDMTVGGQNIKATPDIKMKGKQPSEMTHGLEMSLRPKTTVSIVQNVRLVQGWLIYCASDYC